VPGPDEFFFAMTLPERDTFDELIDEVTTTVFRHVGCGSAAIADMVQQLHAVVPPMAGDAAGLDVQFRARGGACEMVVRLRDRELWRASRPIP
jgi:hypothetical protein